jgi:triacylglycerol lipase
MGFFRTVLQSLSVLALITSVSACSMASGDDREGSGESALTAANYPIVLAHGFFGFKDFAGADFLTYFYGVEADLKAHGVTQVFTPAVDPFNDSTVRGQQLEAKIIEILKQTGAQKVNIIGHSQGGLDARVVAHHRPDLVASVTTISSPHGGSHLSDVVLGLTDVPIIGNITGQIVDALVRVLGTPIWDQIGNDTSVTRALRQISTSGMRTFNAQYPDSPGVRYFSVAGRTGDTDGGDGCRVDNAPGFIASTAKSFDGTDPLLALPKLGSEGWPFHNEPTDGFVRTAEAHWGTFLGCVPADHFDEIGQLLGDKAGGNNPWDYLEFYRDLVAHLRSQGL